jgi:hypothetical protein
MRIMSFYYPTDRAIRIYRDPSANEIASGVALERNTTRSRT